jgi:predicted transcriptional regulator
MVCSLKTTFDIPEPLLRDVQKLARERNTTTESLVEQALRKLLAERAQDRRRSKPRPDTGLAGIAVAAVAERGWPRLTRTTGRCERC